MSSSTGAERTRSATAVYAYCIVGQAVRPARRRVAPLPGAGPVRVLPIARRVWLVVSDVPTDAYGEAALRSSLADLTWVSRVSLAHQRVVASFLPSTAVLPLRLLTLFSSDALAVAHVSAILPAVGAHLERVARHDEWGLRVVRRPAAAARDVAPDRTASTSGTSYLAAKRAQRRAAAHRASQAGAVAAAVFEQLSRHASLARQRTDEEAPAGSSALLLDAALLVRRSRAVRFRAAVRKAAEALHADGYDLTLTGPWPPYSFVQD